MKESRNDDEYEIQFRNSENRVDFLSDRSIRFVLTRSSLFQFESQRD